MRKNSGTLYLVGTPIGNLEDMTQRALNTLKQVDIIACEDKRRSQTLLNHFGITGKRLLVHNQVNERKSAPGLVKLLEDGANIALVTDSGMPSISDPGYILVKAAQEAEIQTQPIPGITAVATALAGAGLPAARFIFLGFLPRKVGEQTRLLERFKDAPEALVIYESPQRLGKTLALAANALGERQACICKELTKLHETFDKGTLA